MKHADLTRTNTVEFGWAARPMKEQHPILGKDDADHFDKDNVAIVRLLVRGLITESQKEAAFKKLTSSIGKAIRRALQESDPAAKDEAQ